MSMVDPFHKPNRYIPLRLFAFLLAIAFLFTQKKDLGDCVKTISIGFGTKISLNCDTESIISDVNDIGAYLTEFSPWRTRPVYIFSLKIISQFLYPASAVIMEVMEDEIGEIVNNRLIDENILSKKKISITSILSVFISAILFNFAVFFVAILVFLRLLKPDNAPYAFGLAALVATSDLVAAWFWIAHPTFMYLLVPLGGMMAFTIGTSVRYRPVGQVMLLGL